MSKINVTIDTDTKDMSVTIDGVEYLDIISIDAYKDEYNDEKHVSFSANLKPVKNGHVTNNTYIRAYAKLNENEKIVKTIADGINIVELSEAKKDTKFVPHWTYQN